MDGPSIVLVEYNKTVIHPLPLLVTLTAVILILTLKRKYVPVPLLIAAIFIPMQQCIVIAGLDFQMIRLLIAAAMLRVLMLIRPGVVKLNRIDVIFGIWILVMVVARSFKFGTADMLINRLGYAYDAMGLYIVARFFMRDVADVSRFVRTTAVSCVVLSAFMIAEIIIHQNIFAMFGGLPVVTIIRGGRYRCQGPFMHPILAGMFGASLVPLFVGHWWCSQKNRKLMVAGAAGAMGVVITSASSGAILTLLAGGGALGFWLFRNYMRPIRWGVVAMLVGLHFYMKDPVWGLLARVNLLGASTGYHRYFLFDQFIRRVSEWWFIGTKTTGHWGYMMWDVTNQYIKVAVEGGLLALVLYLLMIGFSFAVIGRSVRQLSESPRTAFFLWSIGCSLAAQAIGFLSVTYFDQVVVIWYGLLGFIASISQFMARDQIKENRPAAKPFLVAGHTPAGAPDFAHVSWHGPNAAPAK